jgi:hypothetical protein
MSGISISLNRENGRWTWRLMMAGTVHDGPRSEDSCEMAAIAADTYRRQLELAEHFPRMKAERSKHSARHALSRAVWPTLVSSGQSAGAEATR